MSMSCIRSAFP